VPNTSIVNTGVSLSSSPVVTSRRRPLPDLGQHLTGLCVRLVYYPPCHSTYNAIERYWAGLEKSWNGYLLRACE